MAPQPASWQSFLGLGLVVAATLGVGFGLGFAVDSALGTSPVFLLVGLGVALVGGIAFAVTKFKQYLKS